MHELGVTQDVLKTVLRHAEENGAERVTTIHLKIGELRDIVDQWMQRFFDYLSKGTIAEGAKLAIERPPIRFQCGCGKEFGVLATELMADQEILCPDCHEGSCTLVSGREFSIESIEVI